jgi:sporulation protein YlmC with PRC-barrel domain
MKMKFKTAASIAALAIASTLGLPDAVQAEFPTERSPGVQGDQKAPPAQGQGSWSDLAQQHTDRPVAGQGGHEDQKQAAAIPARQPDMVLGSSLINTSVYGPDDSTIGEVEDILIKSDGKIEGLVVGVGGFLGIGEKNVALTMDQFKVMPDADGQARITVSATEDELRKAPEFNMKQGQAS